MDQPVLLGRLCVAVACAAARAALVGAGGGCGSSSRGKAAAEAASLTERPGGAASSAQVLGANFGNAADGAGDPGRSPDGVTRSRVRVVQLEIYRLVVPHGAISRSEEFWKHIDEQQVDVGTYDLLRKNGWRLGTAPSSEWPYFRDIIDGYPASSKPHGLPADPDGGGSHTELAMKQGVAEQNIFYFSADNALWGRSYDRCDNLLSISLQQAPRKAGEARVTVCPTVRSHRLRIEARPRGGDDGEDREYRFVHPERLYDLNLQADIPTDHFLVIAPSPEVRRRTSLGAAFLIEDGPAERLEHVLLLVPRVKEVEETTKPPAPPGGARAARQ